MNCLGRAECIIVSLIVRRSEGNNYESMGYFRITPDSQLEKKLGKNYIYQTKGYFKICEYSKSK